MKRAMSKPAPAAVPAASPSPRYPGPFPAGWFHQQLMACVTAGVTGPNAKPGLHWHCGRDAEGRWRCCPEQCKRVHRVDALTPAFPAFWQERHIPSP